MCMMDLHVSHQTAHKKRRYLGHVFCALMYPLRFLTSESAKCNDCYAIIMQSQLIAVSDFHELRFKSGGEYANSSYISFKKDR